MARRTCPACARRYAGTVDPDCPVCEGVGVLALHPVALYRSDIPVVARAIELYLEASARDAANQLPLGEPRRNALAQAVTRLRKARVIDAPLGVADAEPTTNPTRPDTRPIDVEASRLAYQLGQPTRPADQANLDADPILYGIDDRPRATGLLPQVSAAGSPSFIAKAADPTDALGPDTRAMAYDRMATDRAAVVVAHAVDAAVNLQTRREARS